MTDFQSAFQELTARYLDGNEPLEPIATEFAKLWALWARSRETATEPQVGPRVSRMVGFVKAVGLGELRPGITDQEALRLQELIAAAAAILPSIPNGAA